MDEADDERQFFGDLAATARQGVEQVRALRKTFMLRFTGGFYPFHGLPM